MGFALEMLHRKHNHCNLKASKTALSTVLHGNSRAKASLHAKIMFLDHEIRSTSAESLAGLAFTKR
jgi:tRNA isopentenyl-2-thiomethyl-A-37 hydroxylase MiaE